MYLDRQIGVTAPWHTERHGMYVRLVDGLEIYSMWVRAEGGRGG